MPVWSLAATKSRSTRSTAVRASSMSLASGNVPARMNTRPAHPELIVHGAISLERLLAVGDGLVFVALGGFGLRQTPGASRRCPGASSISSKRARLRIQYGLPMVYRSSSEVRRCPRQRSRGRSGLGDEPLVAGLLGRFERLPVVDKRRSGRPPASTMITAGRPIGSRPQSSPADCRHRAWPEPRLIGDAPRRGVHAAARSATSRRSGASRSRPRR